MLKIATWKEITTSPTIIWGTREVLFASRPFLTWFKLYFIYFFLAWLGVSLMVSLSSPLPFWNRLWSQENPRGFLGHHHHLLLPLEELEAPRICSIGGASMWLQCFVGRKGMWMFSEGGKKESKSRETAQTRGWEIFFPLFFNWISFLTNLIPEALKVKKTTTPEPQHLGNATLKVKNHYLPHTKPHLITALPQNN